MTDAEILPTNIARYQIRSVIGRGGMGVVYLAHDPNIGREVAIKLLPPNLAESKTAQARFEREARAIAALEHPAIVPVYDFGTQLGQLFLVMRYMPGGSLAERLEHGHMQTADVLKLLLRLAPALDMVHAAEVVHRDLKPANILFDQQGYPYLSDFGLVRLMNADVSLTGDRIVGTPSYMSPEQVRGEKDLDGRSDVYALGVMLFEMLSGQRPFQGDSPSAVAMSHIIEPVPSILRIEPSLPPALDGVIRRALAKSRLERFGCSGELAQALQNALQGRDEDPPAVVQTPETASPPAPKFPAARPAVDMVCGNCGYALPNDDPCPVCGGTRRLHKTEGRK